MNTHSSPSDLRITDMRVVNLSGVPMRSTLLRLDTNQGIYGLGEVRDGASHIYALQLKRQLLGENPCNDERKCVGTTPCGCPLMNRDGYRVRII